VQNNPDKERSTNKIQTCIKRIKKKIPWEGWMSVVCVSVCLRPIPSTEESYRLWCVTVWSRNLKEWGALTRVGVFCQKNMFTSLLRVNLFFSPHFCIIHLTTYLLLACTCNFKTKVRYHSSVTSLMAYKRPASTFKLRAWRVKPTVSVCLVMECMTNKTTLNYTVQSEPDSCWTHTAFQIPSSTVRISLRFTPVHFYPN
jgi:hypothetical protein